MAKKKKKYKLQLIDYFIITCLVLLVFCILFLVFNKDKKETVTDENIQVSEKESVGFKLNGKEKVTIKKNGEYKERGFAAFSTLEGDISDYVTMSGNVDPTEPGIYKLYYTLEYKTVSETLERTVEVVDKYSVMINGDAVVYVLKGSEYKEQGVSVTSSDGSKIEHEVKIENEVDTNVVGDYYINYKVTFGDVEQELMRKVVVYEMVYELKANTNESTSDKVILSFNTESEYYAYTIYNDKKTSLKKFDVEVYSNMKITYKIYDVFGNFVTKEMDVKNINRVAMSATCTATVANDKTVYNVGSNRTISKVDYYGAGIRVGSDKSPNYTYKGKLNPKSSISVVVYDNSNNTVKADCKIVDKTTSTSTTPSASPQPSTSPQTSPSTGSGSVVFSSNSNTMKVTITKNSTYYITRVWMSNPHQQINKFDSPSYGKSLVRPSKLLSNAVTTYGLTNKALVGFNASGFYLKDTYDSASVNKYPAFDKTSVGTIVITNGQVVRNAYTKAYKTWYIAGVDSSNTLRIFTDAKASSDSELAAKKTWADGVINSGIRNTFTFAGPLVIDGKATSSTTSFPSSGSALNRQAICQVDANNFVLITGTNLTRQNLIDIMLKLNCRTGTNLDGGGSIALLYKQAGSNEIKKVIGDSRSLTEVGYFSD